MDDLSSASRGKHELLALGYNESAILPENSWGTHWANAGFGRVSWRVVEHDVSEAYTIDGFANDMAASKTPFANLDLPPRPPVPSCRVKRDDRHWAGATQASTC